MSTPEAILIGLLIVGLTIVAVAAVVLYAHAKWQRSRVIHLTRNGKSVTVTGFNGGEDPYTIAHRVIDAYENRLQ